MVRTIIDGMLSFSPSRASRSCRLRKLGIVPVFCIFAMLCLSPGACSIDSGGTPSSNGSRSTAKVPVGSVPATTITCVAGTLQASGSSAAQPFLKVAATDYQKKCPGANIVINDGGSNVGLRDTQNGSSAIGASDIFADKATYPDLVDNQVAVVVFSVVINGKVTGVTTLTSTQLKGIYAGTIRNWRTLGGPDLAIVPISRPIGSGIRITFETYILGTKESVTGNPIANASREVSDGINQIDGAIAYVATDSARKNNLTTIKIDGVDGTDIHVVNNTYKYWNIEHMYTRGPATGLARSFIDFVKSSDEASVRQQQGFLDMNKMSQKAIAAKTPLERGS